MKIRFRLLVAGLLLCSAALTDAGARTPGDQKTGGKPAAAGSSKKKTPAASKPAGGARAETARKPAARAVAPKSPAKPASAAKTPDKNVASVKKKARPEPAAPLKKAAVRAAAPTVKKTVKPAGRAPEKTLAAVSGSGKKSRPAAGSPAAGTSRAGTAVKNVKAAGKAGKSGKKKISPAAEPEAENQDTDTGADGENSGERAVAGMFNPAGKPFFVSPRVGRRLFGMPTSLPVTLSSGSLLENLAAMNRRPPLIVRREPDSAAALKGPQPAPKAPLVDAGKARAAMAAMAEKQNAFRPALVGVRVRLEPDDGKAGSGTPSAAAERSRPAAFVIKSAAPPSAAPPDDFSGFGDFLFSRTVPASLKEPAVKGAAAAGRSAGPGGGREVSRSRIADSPAGSPARTSPPVRKNSPIKTNPPVKDGPSKGLASAAASRSVSAAALRTPARAEAPAGGGQRRRITN